MQVQPARTHTTKGERTREHILETALRLFGEKGYEATTMRDIAAAAGCSLGLAYRYFARKDDLVLALYQRLADEFADRVAELRPLPLADRFAEAMRIKIELVAPYRDTFGAIIGAALTPRSGIAVLSEENAAISRHVATIFFEVVRGATDAPRERQARQLAEVLYAAHLSLLLFWLNDTSPGTQATFDLLRLARDGLALARPFLRFPPVARALSRLAQAIGPVFHTGKLV